MTPDELLRWSEFASGVQRALELALVHLADTAVQLSGDRELALSGGVALNCSANGRLRQHLGRRLHLHGLVGDAGTSIGAGALVLHQARIQPAGLNHAYLSKEWSDDGIRTLLADLHLPNSDTDNLEAKVAQRILAGQSVGWVQGAAEAGPRALGHRSILANPFSSDTKARLNHTKRRASWRPFAPVTLPSSADSLFEAGGSPYMIEAVQAPEIARRTVPAVIHHDGSSRVQIVDPANASSRLVRLLSEIEGEAGHGIVVNTSFNVGPEPIVFSPEDAVRTFYGSNLEAMALGPVLLTKKH